jgi:hypothetical protein
MSGFQIIQEYPNHISGTSIIVRLLDGLGFRFYWSTVGLTENEYNFRPAKDCMSIEELVKHIWGLVNWICISMLSNQFKKPKNTTLLRESILEMLSLLRETLVSMDDKELAEVKINNNPFWHIINGPLADALTHVGQINSFRRLSNNPVPKANAFLGKPPKS